MKSSEYTDMLVLNVESVKTQEEIASLVVPALGDMYRKCFGKGGNVTLLESFTHRSGAGGSTWVVEPSQ